MLKNRIFSGIGSSIEWFDFALYGYFGPIFAVLFFPKTDHSHEISLIYSYAIFAVGFAARPLGGLFFGYLGDKYGRILPLRITPIAMTLTAIAMALLPTFDKIGYASIALLILIRIVQGFLMGGEFAGNILYLSESSKKWRFLWGGLGSCTGSIGILLASLVAATFYTLFSREFMFQFGWRIAFLCIMPLGAIAFYVRLKLEESPEYHQSFLQNNPFRRFLKSHKQVFFQCLGLLYLHATSFYFTFMFLPIYLKKIRGLSTSIVLTHNTSFLLIHIAIIPIIAFFLNTKNSIKLYLAITFIFSCISIPVFYFFAYGGEYEIVAGFLLFSILSSVNAALIPGLLISMIPADVRNIVFSLSFNIGFGVFGGVTPLLCLLSIKEIGSIMSPALYLTFSAVITLLCVLLGKIERDHGTRQVSSS